VKGNHQNLLNGR